MNPYRLYPLHLTQRRVISTSFVRITLVGEDLDVLTGNVDQS